MSRSTWSNTTEKVLQHHKLQLEIATLLAAQRKRDETMSFEHNPVFLQLAHLEIDLPQLLTYKDVYLKTKKVMQKRSAEADSSDCILCPKQSRSSLLAQPDEIAFECEDGHCPLSLVFTLNQRKKV